MEGADRQAAEARNRIADAQKRLAALQELGLDTAALRSQLAFAVNRLAEGAIDDADRICEEVLATARRVANGSGEIKVRTVRLTREELAGELRDLLSQGLFAKLMAEHQGGPDPRIEARLSVFDQHVRDYLQTSHRSLSDTCSGIRRELHEAVETLRGEVALVRRPPTDEKPSSATRAAVTTLAGQQREGATAIATAIEELGERLAARLEASQADQVRLLDAWNAATDRSSGHHAALVATLRDSLSEVGMSLHRHASADPTTTSTSPDDRLSSGMERIAAALERPANSASDQIAAELRTLTETLHQRLEQDSAVATALRDGLGDLGKVIAARAETRIEAPVTAPTASAHDEAADHVLMESMTALVAQLETAQQHMATTVDAGLARIADQLATSAAAIASAGIATAEVASDPSPRTPTIPGFDEDGSTMIARAVTAPDTDVFDHRPTTQPSGRVKHQAAEPITHDQIRAMIADEISRALAASSERTLAESMQSLVTQLESAQQHMATSVEVGFAKIAEQLATSTTPIPAESMHVVDENGSTKAKPIINENDETRFEHQATTSRVAALAARDEVHQSQAYANKDHIRSLVRDEIGRAMAADEQRSRLAGLLPGLLKEPTVSHHLFALIAMEAVSHPGVLGELTGLRGFLRRELKTAVEALAKDLQPTL